VELGVREDAMTRDPKNNDEPENMTERDVASLLSQLIQEQPDLGEVPLVSVSTFKNGEIEGLLLRFGDGSEFQLRIVRTS
jgi:hypothetical protein